MVLFRSFLMVAILTQALACASPAPQYNSPEKKPVIPEISQSAVEYADARLIEAGLSAAFIQSLHAAYLDHNPEWRENVKHIVELNVFGFLSHPDYSVHDTASARKHISEYLKNHRKSFQEVRKRYAVSSNSIASLMWVETKYGKVMGKVPVAWVYYSLILGAHPDFVKEMVTLLPSKLEKENLKKLSLIEAENKVIDRCRSKSIWALDEIKAVNFIQEAKFFNPLKTKASFAGAFGLGQFIPSSYLKFSESLYRKKADLFKPSDAILSIAHFLKENGWDEKNRETKEKALFAYNRSKDYGAVILKLSDSVGSTKTKVPAQVSSSKTVQ